MTRVIDERHMQMYTAFCDALENDFTTDQVFDLYQQANEAGLTWNRALQGLIQARQSGSDMTGAIESITMLTNELDYVMDSSASMADFQRRSDWIAMIQAAIETACSNRMDAYNADAAMEAETFIDEAMDQYIAEKIGAFELLPATEGTNIDAIKLVNNHLKDTRSLKKEMNEAKSKGDWKAAAAKAEEIARMADRLSKDIEALPQSVGSAVIVTIVLAIAAIAAAVGMAAIGRKVGFKIAEKVGAEPSELIGKQAGNTAASKFYKEGVNAAKASAKQNMEKAAADRAAAAAERAAREKAAAAAAQKAKGKVSVSFGFGKHKVSLNDAVKKAGDTVKNTAGTIDEAKARMGDVARYKEEVANATKKVAEDARKYGAAVSKAKAADVLKTYTDTGAAIGTGAGAATVGVPVAIASLNKILSGKKVIDENGNPKKVALSPNEWNALIKWAKGVANDMKEKYLEKAASFRARAKANEAFVFYMEYTDPAIEAEYFDEMLLPATEGVNAETLDIWRRHSKEIRKLRKDMKYAAEAGSPKIAADKAMAICHKCDETMKILGELPQSAWSMLLPKILIMVVVALVGVKVGPWIGEAGGKWIGSNMARAAAQDLPKFMGKPIEEITKRVFGVAGAVVPGIFAFKQLMAFLKGKAVITEKGVVTTTRLEPNEANMLMNMAKESIRSCKRKYEELAKLYLSAEQKRAADEKILRGGNESNIVLHRQVWNAIESILCDEYGELAGTFDSSTDAIGSFMSSIC